MTAGGDLADRRRTPGDLLLHPVALVSIGVIVVNDRVLKGAMPGALTGKLSDVAGMVFFPLLLVSAAEVLRWIVRRRPWQLGPTAVIVAAIAVGIGFALTKTWRPGAEAYRSMLGYALWPAYAVVDLVRGRSPSPVRRFDVVEDPTDLAALVALMVPIWVARVRR